MDVESVEVTVGFVEAWLAQNGINYVIALGKVVILLVAGSFIIKWARKLVKVAMFKTYKGNPMVPDFITSIVSKVLWLLLLMMAAKLVGLDITPLIAGLGVTGFVVGFACQDSLANLAAGLMIAGNEPFTVGDSVTVAGVTGMVVEVSMMATIVKDETGNRVVIPNKSAWGGVITNRTRKLG